MIRRPRRSTLFPYPTLFRSGLIARRSDACPSPSRLKFPLSAPTWPVQTNGHAMTKTATAKLEKVRHALLQLHKTLLDAQRIRYEREYVRVESTGALLALALEDPSAARLRVPPLLIAQLG